MNPVTYALQQVKFQIPHAILEKTFLSVPDPRYRGPISMDARIRNAVIEDRVMVDCNLVGGTETFISLAGCPMQQIDPFTYVYTVPKTRTQGRTITRALSVSFGQGSLMGSVNIGQQASSPLLDAAAGVLSASMPIPVISTAYCQLVGENVVMISDNASLPADIYLRCWLENDEAFNHIQPTSYPEFAQLVIFAVKAYIYNNLQIPMDRAFIHAGSELGRFKDIVDSYSDANQNYADQLTVWRKVAHFNDFEAHNRHLKHLVGGQW